MVRRAACMRLFGMGYQTACQQWHVMLLLPGLATVVDWLPVLRVGGSLHSVAACNFILQHVRRRWSSYAKQGWIGVGGVAAQ